MPTDYAALREERMRRLDAETRAIYEQISGGFGIRSIGIEKFRTLFSQILGDKQDLHAGVAAETISVPRAGGEVKARVYVPQGEDPAGVYVHTHGGGWIAWAGLDHVDAHNSELAVEWECAVVHPDFRVPPEDPFPAAIEDCWSVVEWIGQHGEELGLDTERIAVGGGCTGANIASVMALMARDAGSPTIALQVLDSPQLDTRCDYRSHFEFAEGYGLSRDDDLFVVEQYLSDAENRWDWRASPVLAESVRGVAPAVVTAGEYEILRDEARYYVSRLRDAGIGVRYIEGEGQGHGFTSWRNLETGQYTRAAARARAEMTEVVRRYIGPSARGQHPG
jgi:acetyl esterase